jgi:hypothetical protein
VLGVFLRLGDFRRADHRKKRIGVRPGRGGDDLLLKRGDETASRDGEEFVANRGGHAKSVSAIIDCLFTKRSRVLIHNIKYRHADAKRARDRAAAMPDNV